MKPNSLNRFALVLSTGTLFAGTSLHAQTVEVDPAGPIPGEFALAKAWEWNTPGNLESWTANSQFVLEAGTPTDDGGGNGSVKGTTNAGDPTFTSPVTAILSPQRVIIEMRINKESSDDSRIDLFWDDAAGGFGGPRVFGIPSATLAPDDNFKVVRITFPQGSIVNQLDRLRLDPVAGLTGVTAAIDYLRVYTEGVEIPLEWDPNTATTAAQGGSGTWDEVSNFWWDGLTNVAWPASGTSGDFAGTAGTVTVDAGGVTAPALRFLTNGYVMQGGPIDVGSDTAVFASVGVTTTLNSSLTGSAPLLLSGSTFILGGNNSSLGGSLTQGSNALGITRDDALGTGIYQMGAGGNAFFVALGGDRTISNDVVIAANRTIIHNGDLGSGLPIGNVTINGDVTLNSVSPGDLYLRKALTINGDISGSNNGIGLLFAGDANTITLNGTNTFTGNIKWANNTLVEALTGASLGDAANALNFNAGAGGVRLLSAFDSARAINVTGSTVGRIDTNGFDSVWSGTIAGTTTATINSRLYKQGAGKLALTGTASLGGGTQVQAGTLEIPVGGSLTHGSTWDNNHGVGGGATFHLNGGTFNIIGSFYGVGNGTGAAEEEALFKMDSGSYGHVGGAVLVGFKSNGRWVMNGGSANINQLNYGDGADSSRIAIIELNGGTLAMDTAGRRAGEASATIKLNGTNLVAKSDQPDYLPVGTAGSTEFLVGSGGAEFSTAGFNIGIANPLEHDPALGATQDGGLIKNGTGTLTLAATNTYTGPTTVNGGTLAVTGESIPNTGNLVINGAGVVEVTADETVNSLFYGEAQQPAGTYGSSTSTATFKDDTRFSGSALLTVNTGAATGGYAAWAAVNAGGQSADLDFDGDGVPNGVEYFMGETGSSFTANPVPMAGTITWQRDPAAAASFTVQVSDTLAPGGWTTITPPDPSIDTSNPAQVVFTVPTGDPKKFVRLNVTVTP